MRLSQNNELVSQNNDLLCQNNEKLSQNNELVSQTNEKLTKVIILRKFLIIMTYRIFFFSTTLAEMGFHTLQIHISLDISLSVH